MPKITKVIVVLILLCAIGAAVGLVKYRALKAELAVAKSALQTVEKNKAIANFNRMFVNKILLNKEQVSFEERLKLENAVRDLKDAEILEAWQVFASSKTDVSAQDTVKKLLGVLAERLAGNSK